MKINDVRLKSVPGTLGFVSIKEENSGNLIAELWPIPGVLNKRQIRILAERMCNAFNADQTYEPLEKKKL